MTPMLEKIARAAYEDWIAEVQDLEEAWGDLPQSHKDRLMRSQRAALLAMREPDDRALDLGSDALMADHATLRDAWPAMIDAILAGETGR